MSADLFRIRDPALFWGIFFSYDLLSNTKAAFLRHISYRTKPERQLLATFPSSCLNNSPNTILLTPLSPSLPSTFINLPFCPHPSQPPPPPAAHFSAAAAGSSLPPAAAAHCSAAAAGSSFPPPAPAAHFSAAATGSSFPPPAAAHFSAAAAGSSFPPPPGQNDEDISPPCSPPQLRIVEDEKEIFMDRYRY
jgi:hypothetical protein